MNVLEDKVAVITGGARGLGLGIARTYVANGARVVIAGRNQAAIDRALAEFGARAAGHACDVGELEQVEALGRFATDTFGKIDIWVNNAGMSAPYGPTAEIPTDAFMGVVDTNIVGTYNGSVVALRNMVPRHSGKVINLLGRGYDQPKGVKLQNPYAASKTWVLSFTRALAEEYKESGVEVFAFNPGLVDSDMVRRVTAVKGYEGRLKPLETVLRLWSNPPEIPAEKALWLASSATDGKSGLVVNVLGRSQILSGVVRDGIRRMMRQPAPDTSLDISIVEPQRPAR